MMSGMRLAAATVLSILIAGCAGTTAVTPSASPLATSTVTATSAARLETVIPGLYPGRTEHIHLKVTVNGKTYTSQLFFPGVSQNEGDSIYSSQMLVTLNTATSPVTGTFTFVVKA